MNSFSEAPSQEPPPIPPRESNFRLERLESSTSTILDPFAYGSQHNLQERKSNTNLNHTRRTSKTSTISNTSHHNHNHSNSKQKPPSKKEKLFKKLSTKSLHKLTRSHKTQSKQNIETRNSDHQIFLQTSDSIHLGLDYQDVEQFLDLDSQNLNYSCSQLANIEDSEIFNYKQEKSEKYTNFYKNKLSDTQNLFDYKDSIENTGGSLGKFDAP